MRVLIIEDEPKAASYLAKGLREQAFTVETAHRGDDGLHLACTSDFDLIVLDVTLPALDGWSVLARLRQQGRETPVLFLTARSAVEERVRGLDLGADDYLVKPFAFSELLARIRSLLRRSPQRQPEVLRVGDLEIDLAKCRITRGQQRIELTPTEFALLSLLARRSGDILTRTVIAEQVWDMNFDSLTNMVDVHIRRLRAKIDEPFSSKLIHTVRGRGYVLEDRPK